MPKALNGGGMFNDTNSSPMLTNVTFSGNSADFGGGGIYSQNSSSPTLTNVTFSGNSAGNSGGAMSNNSSSNPMLTNVILWGNTAGSSGPQIFNSSSTPVINYSLIQGWAGGGTGNLALDPQFVDADGADNILGTEDDNLRLACTSPAINVGDTAALPPDTLDLDGDGNTSEPIPYDLDGNPRLDGTVDMGAYERVGGATCPPPADPTNLTATAASRTQIDLTWTDNATDETGYEVERSTDGGTTWSPLASLPANSQSHADTGLTCGTTYHYRVYATNADGNSGYSNVASATTDACRLYVDADSTGNNDGSSWADAFTSLQDALAGAAPGYEIWVAEGVYYPDEGAGQTNGDRAATFQLRDGVAIYGGFAGTETLLSQRDPAAHVTILSGDIGQDDLNADGNFIAEDTGDLVGHHVLPLNAGEKRARRGNGQEHHRRAEVRLQQDQSHWQPDQHSRLAQIQQA